MTLTSTNNPSAIFEDGKLKPGIYKIQNLCSEACVDIHESAAREVHLRSAQDLREGRGLVRLDYSPVACVFRLMIRSGKSNPSEPDV